MAQGRGTPINTRKNRDYETLLYIIFWILTMLITSIFSTEVVKSVSKW